MSHFRLPLLILSAVVLFLVLFLSLAMGSKDIPLSTVQESFSAFSSDNYDHIIIRTLRVPRTLIGLAVGMALTLSGIAMQAITGNPLAGPSLIGINSGASLAIVLSVYFLGLVNPLNYLWFAFIGAAGAALLVFAVSSTSDGRISPLTLALAGVIVSALLNSLLSLVLLFNQETLDIVRFWLVGSLAGRQIEPLLSTGPFLAAGVLVILFSGTKLNIISMGDETAISLGLHPVRFRIIIGIVVVFASGASVSIAGPIAFVGLAVPHLIRLVIGPDYRWIMAFGLFIGPVFLIASDILARFLIRPTELYVGIITAIVGAVTLIILIRTKRISL